MGQFGRDARGAHSVGLGAFADDLRSTLVLAQAAKGGVAQILVSRPAAELDLGNQLRLDVSDLARRVGAEPFRERAGRRADALEPMVQILGHRGGKSGPDAAGMDQLAVLIVAEHQGTDGLARGGGRHIAGDHKFLALLLENPD